MRAIAKSAKIHPAAKKCCGWGEPAICESTKDSCPYMEMNIGFTTTNLNQL